MSLLAFAGLTLCVACGPQVKVNELPEEEGRLKAVAKVYALANRDLGRPPKNLEELTRFFPERAGDPAQYLSSARDGQPYTIIWGVDLANKYRGSTLPLAYEQQGAEGFRYVGSCRGEVARVPDEAFGGLEFPAGHKPAQP